MMKIQLGGLSEGTHNLRFALPAAEAGLDARFQDEVAVLAEVQKRGQEHLLRATVAVTGAFVCDRCLEEVRLPLSTSYVMYYVIEEGAHAGVDPSEVQVLPPGETVVDITDDVRQTVLLGIPQKLLCREDCLGLCPRCGANRNTSPCTCAADAVDPRWERLKGMRG